MEELQKADALALNKATTGSIPIRPISLAVVVTLLLYVYITTPADWESIIAVASVLPGLLWVHVVLLSAVSYLLRFVRWHHFICSMGHKVPALVNLEIYFAAFALTISPGKAGETIRSVYLHPYGVSYPHSLGAFVSERLLDLVAVGVLASGVMFMFPEQRTWLLATIAFVTIAIMLLRSRLITLISKQTARGAFFGHSTNLIASVRFLLSGRRLGVAAHLSLAAWVAQGVSLYLIVNALGYELAAISVISIYCLSILAGAASFIPGGIGATEAAIVLLLSISGVGQADAIIASLISRGVTLWLAISLGVISMIKLTISRESH